MNLQLAILYMRMVLSLLFAVSPLFGVKSAMPMVQSLWLLDMLCQPEVGLHCLMKDILSMCPDALLQHVLTCCRVHDLTAASHGRVYCCQSCHQDGCVTEDWLSCLLGFETQPGSGP